MLLATLDFAGGNMRLLQTFIYTNVYYRTVTATALFNNWVVLTGVQTEEAVRFSHINWDNT